MVQVATESVAPLSKSVRCICGVVLKCGIWNKAKHWLWCKFLPEWRPKQLSFYVDFKPNILKCWNALNPRHNNKYVVWITLKILFPWNLIKSYRVYKTKPRSLGGRKMNSGYISKWSSLAELKLLHWNHSNGIFWLRNKVALSLFNFTVLSAVSCFLLHWQLCSHLIR